MSGHYREDCRLSGALRGIPLLMFFVYMCVLSYFNIVFCEDADSIFAHYSYVFVFIQYAFVNYSIYGE